MKSKVNGKAETGGQHERRIYGIVVMMCGFLILLDLFLIAHLSAEGVTS